MVSARVCLLMMEYECTKEHPMTISIQRITCREAWENPAWPKIVKEYGEDVRYPDLEPDPDYQEYLWLEIKGTLHSVGAFDGDRLVGFVNYLSLIHI